MNRCWAYATLAALVLSITPVLRGQGMMGQPAEPSQPPEVEARAEARAEPATPEGSSHVEPEAEGDAESSTRRRARLTKPWSDLASLTDDQRDQIRVIHGEGLDERRESELREHNRIMALLSDEQKAELQALLDEQAMQRKLREAERRESHEQGQPAPDAEETEAPAAPSSDGAEVAPDAQP